MTATAATTTTNATNTTITTATDTNTIAAAFLSVIESTVAASSLRVVSSSGRRDSLIVVIFVVVVVLVIVCRRSLFGTDQGFSASRVLACSGSLGMIGCCASRLLVRGRDVACCDAGREIRGFIIGIELEKVCFPKFDKLM